MNETNQYVHRFCFFIDLESDEKEASNISPDELTTAYAMRVNEIEESPSIPDELFHQSTYDKKAGVFSPKTKFFGKDKQLERQTAVAVEALLYKRAGK